jgi:hypothetical protein
MVEMFNYFLGDVLRRLCRKDNDMAYGAGNKEQFHLMMISEEL